MIVIIVICIVLMTLALATVVLLIGLGADAAATTVPPFGDFKDAVYPFESDILFLEYRLNRSLFFSVFSNQGMSKQYTLTVFLESPTLRGWWQGGARR